MIRTVAMYFLITPAASFLSNFAVAADYPYSCPNKTCLTWKDCGPRCRKIENKCNHEVTVKADIRGPICTDEWFSVHSNDFDEYNAPEHCKIYAFECH